MKKIIILIAAIAISITAYCQGGVNFEELTFEEALAKAKAENKLVFMDCYTSWCGPCKYMLKTIFPLEEVGAFFNPRFISVKYDMEKGEGPELKKKYGVNTYPTFLIIRPDGSVQHKAVGGRKQEIFMAAIERGANEKTSLGYLSKVYEKGKMNKKQFMDYVIALQDAIDNQKREKVLRELGEKVKEKDKVQKEYWSILRYDGYGTDNFKFIVRNLPVLRKNIGKEDVDAHLSAYYSMTIDNAGREAEPKQVLAQIRQELSTLDLEDRNQLINRTEVAEARIDQNVEKIISLAEQVTPSTFDDIYPLLQAFDAVKSKATKSELKHIAELGDRFIANLSKDEMIDYVKSFFEEFRIAAYSEVYFQDLTFDQALEKAKKENKRLFIDCYTSWCGPCKHMTNTVFKEENVGDFMNENFICLKFDMEKGEGPELMKKLELLQIYPTFLLLNPDGTMRHKFIGGGDAEKFIKRVEEGLDDNKALSVLIRKYENGDRDKAFLLQYIKTLNGACDDNAPKVADELMKLATNEEKLSPDYSYIFLSPSLSPKGSEAEKFLFANREKLNTVARKEKVDRRLSGDLLNELMQSIATKGEKTDAKRLEAIGKEIKALKLYNETSFLALQNIAKTLKAGNIDRLLSACEKGFPQIEQHQNQFIVYYLNNVFENATGAQKTSWQKITQNIPEE